MTQEDKELLLKDLTARLPYDVYVHIRFKEGEPCYGKLTPRDIQWFIDSKIEVIKPYLRPLSSMTKEERRELCNIRPCYINSDDIVNGTQCNTFIQASECQDWLNAHHFDYRGLIPMGLALEAPEGIYEIK